MGLFDFCNMTFLIGAAVTIFIIVSIYGYITYKMAEQDHKISTMLGIISSMAQEQEFLRKKLTNKAGGKTFGEGGTISLENDEFDNRIEVSDGDDEAETESEDEQEESEEDEEEEDESGENDSESEDETYDDTNSKKILNIHLGTNTNDISPNNLIEHTIEHFSDDESSLSLDSGSVSESESDNSTMTKITNIKTIHLEDSITINEIPPPLQTEHLDFLKTLHITNQEESETTDYKKMPVQKLRNIIVEKGISTATDPSKLKKPELLKLVEGLQV